MSQGPFGLTGGTLDPGPAPCAIVNVAPIAANTSASIRTRLILVFMFFLSAFQNSKRLESSSWDSHGSGGWDASHSKR
jgi:hypothetical protein